MITSGTGQLDAGPFTVDEVKTAASCSCDQPDFAQSDYRTSCDQQYFCVKVLVRRETTSMASTPSNSTVELVFTQFIPFDKEFDYQFLIPNTWVGLQMEVDDARCNQFQVSCTSR